MNETNCTHPLSALIFTVRLSGTAYTGMTVRCSNCMTQELPMRQPELAALYLTDQGAFWKLPTPSTQPQEGK